MYQYYNVSRNFTNLSIWRRNQTEKVTADTKTLNMCANLKFLRIFQRSGQFKGSKKSSPPQNVPRHGSKSYCPAKKKYVPQFLKQRDINSYSSHLIWGARLSSFDLL